MVSAFSALSHPRGTFRVSFLVAVVVLLAPWQSRAQNAPRHARPLRVAYLSTSATMASVWMAKEMGAFAKEGLDIEVLSMSSSSPIPALIANEIDVVQVSAAPVITASLRGIDVVFIAGLLNTMIWDFTRARRSKILSSSKVKLSAPTAQRRRSPTAHSSR
jgi:ABC-type nitrate/sulfonate/bicarbonate transport system substrate-binding protein